MMRFSVVVVTIIGICLSASVVLAECPDGKSEVLLVTPSGKEKLLCVSDNAMDGIENAAEHSPALFTSTTETPEGTDCPCYEAADLDGCECAEDTMNCGVIGAGTFCRHYVCKGVNLETMGAVGEVASDEMAPLACYGNGRILEIGDSEYESCLTLMGMGN